MCLLLVNYVDLFSTVIITKLEESDVVDRHNLFKFNLDLSIHRDDEEAGEGNAEGNDVTFYINVLHLNVIPLWGISVHYFNISYFTLNLNLN